MKSLHLNLLKESERLSSSPVRLRVMLPLLALFTCIGLTLWWATLLTQLFVVRAEAQTIDDELRTKSEAQSDATRQQDLVRERRQQLEQLAGYRRGLRAVAAPLARLAEVMPPKVQLTELSFAPPPPETPPKPGQPPTAPVTNVETQRLVLTGRTTGNTPVEALMAALEETGFERLVTKEKRIKSFRHRRQGEAPSARL